MEKKKDQIIAMFGVHNRKEFTSFYNEEIEMTSILSEFMEAIGISETKLTIKSSNIWVIPPAVSQMLLGTIVDPMDPTFTIPQYVTIAALSYLEHLKKTKPEEVEGLVVSPTIIREKLDMTGNPITTWCPLNINIGNLEISLSTLMSENRIMDTTMTRILKTLSDLKNVSTLQIKNFLISLILIIPACMDPSSRVFV